MDFAFLLNYLDEKQEVRVYICDYELFSTADALAALLNSEVLNASVRSICAEGDELKVWLEEDDHAAD